MSSDKGENISNPPSACEKVCTAIFCCSCPQEEHAPASTAQSAEARDVQTKSRRAEVGEHKLELASKEAAKTGGHGQTRVENEDKVSSEAKNEIFSEYINRAKKKIRTMSSLGSGKTSPKAVDVHDATTDNSGSKDNSASKDIFSDYIKRAKMKIRKTPSIGSRKSGSRKRE